MTPSLFPEYDREVVMDSVAARRETIQHARHYLTKRDFTRLVNYLLENGPQLDHNLSLEYDDFSEFVAAMFDLHALWLVGKLWRVPMGIHPCSGQECFCYGIRKVHSRKQFKTPKDFYATTHCHK